MEQQKRAEGLSEEDPGIGKGPDIQITSLELNAQDVSGFLRTEDRNKIFNILTKIPNGVMSMSHHFDGLVQTSSNLGVVKMAADFFQIIGMARSSLDSELQTVAENIKITLQQQGAEFLPGETSSGWEVAPESPLLAIAHQVAEQTFGQRLQKNHYHAGLETGIFNRHLGGNADMLSTGPKILGAHTPKESISIDSVKEWWQFFTKYLEEIAKSDQ